MKTTLISVITFIIGLFAGFCSHLFKPAEFIDSSRTEDGLRPKAHLSALPKTGTVAALHTDDDKATSSDPFAEWEAALKENKLKDASLRGDLIERMIALNPQRAWQMLMDSGLHVSLHDITTVAQHWSRKNPAEAAAFGLTLTDPLQRPAFLVHPGSWCGGGGMMAEEPDEPEFAISCVWRARGLRVSQHEVC